MNRIILYYLRWLLSGIVMLPFLYLFQTYSNLNYYITLLILQMIGATIFYNIDKRIFKDKPKCVCANFIR